MIQNTNKSAFWKRHLDKFGVVGSVFSALCCLGFPALLSLLTAIGLRFLINDAILLPLLGMFLLITIAGLEMGRRLHHKPGALIFGIISAVALALFIFPFYNGVLAGLSIVGLIIASVLNVVLQQRSKEEPAP